MADPMISVVVPVYNVEQYIKLCVDSILAQTFTDFEIILVDDASPDNCFDICQKLYGGNEKVRIIRHEQNRGLGPARNTGMKHARGKYIYFVDSDDFILPDALEKLFSAAEKTNAQVVRTAGFYELHQNEPLPIRDENLKLTWAKWNQEGFLARDIFFRFDHLWKNAALNPAAWCCLYRRDFLEKNRLEFLPIICEDVPFHLVNLGLAERYYILHDSAYVYRVRDNSIMTAKDAGKLSRAIHAMIIGLDYIKNFLHAFLRGDDYRNWRDDLLMAYINSFFIKQTVLPYYENLSVSPEVAATIDGTLGKFFGGGKDFVKYFFNSYNLYRRQGELLMQQIAQQGNEISSLIDHAELSPKKIVFDNFAGRGYGCNPKYIAEEILRQNLPYDLVWLVKNINEPMPAKIRKVKFGSLDSVYELATAKVVVTNHKSRLPFPSKKRGQFFIMTWHGGLEFKRIESEVEEKLSASYVAQAKAISAMTDLMMVSCRNQYDNFRRVMWYNGEILTCGLPRNDIFFRRDEKLIAHVRKNLHVPEGNKILMYAPTFRDDHANTDVYKFNAQKILTALTKRFGGKWTLLIRFHPNVAKEKFAQAAFANAINATNYPDMQELILISDALISDYSSVIYDFMISRKPVFIYAKDFDSYPTERGFKPLFFELPYSVNRTEPELLKAIKNFDDAKLASKIRKFTDAIKPFDNGHAAEVVVSRIRSAIDVTPPPNHSSVPTEKTPPEDFFRQCMANPIFRNNIDMLMKVPIQEKDAQNILQTLDLVENKYFYELMDVRPWKPKILDVDSGIDELLASGKSFCRLGDGECMLMQGKDLGFQKHDPRLAEKLLQILSDAQTNCYVGLPRYYWYFRDDVERSGNPFHKRYYTFKIPPIRKFFADHCNESKTYIDACLGAYMSNKSAEFCAARFQKLKTLFNGRKVLIVAGETVFQNITHDFFDGVTQKELLLAPRINAWSKFDEILGKILTYPEDFVVVLILGPTATVLAYELSKLGRVAYDIGHVPKDYDAFLKSADRSSGAIGKFYAPD